MEDGKVDLIKASRHTHVASHCFYADDLMVFCKWKLFSMENLKDLFTRYVEFSGKLINLNKYSIFVGGVSEAIWCIF